MRMTRTKRQEEGQEDFGSEEPDNEERNTTYRRKYSAHGIIFGVGDSVVSSRACILMDH